jgi:hypothetical protein
MKWVPRSVCSASANMLKWDVEEIASFGLFGLSANNTHVLITRTHFPLAT